MITMEWETLSNILFVLAVFIIGFYIFILFIAILSVIGGWCTMHKKVDISMFKEDLPGVSIIKLLMDMCFFTPEALLISTNVLFNIVHFITKWCTMHKKVDISMFKEDLPGVSIIKPLMGIPAVGILWCTMHKKVDISMFKEDLPGVSIIKPLMGIDPLLEYNLESHFTLKYPKFELLFCVEDEEDPVIDLVHKLSQKYSNVDTRMFIGGKNGIINPLVRNMVPAYDGAKYDFLWISTSRILVNTEIAYDLASKLNQPNVGLVHQMPFTTDQAGMVSAIDKVSFGSVMARVYISASLLGFLCFVGMSYMLKKSALDEVYGLGYYGQYLAEDYFMSRALWNRGYKARVCSIPAQQNVVATSIAAYKDRMVRWLRLRLNMVPVTCGIIEPMAECLPLGILGALAVFYMFNAHPVIFFSCHLLFWIILDYIRLRIVQGGPLQITRWKFLVAWLIRELLYVFIYFEALLSVNRIEWGRRTYRVTLGGHTEIVNARPLQQL